MKKISGATQTADRYRICTDCGKFRLLRIYVTGAPLCECCGSRETAAALVVTR